MAQNSDTEKREPVTYSCGGCPNRWSGSRMCHCAACHRTFSGLELFDKHRRTTHGYSHCVSPEMWGDSARLVGGIWRGPERDPSTWPAKESQPASGVAA